MNKLQRSDLFTLEQYAEKRARFRADVIAHKKNRRIPLGPDTALYFEDRVTLQYQIQEMLRIERIFEPAGIQEELDAYNPLIPDGSNLKATFMVEIANESERRKRLAEWIGIEHRVWMRVEGFDPVFAIADEDLERANAEKTSSVHFMRFEFTEQMIAALKRGAALAAGIDFDPYRHSVEVLSVEVTRSLLYDFD